MANTILEQLGSPMTKQVGSCEFKMSGNRKRKWLTPQNYFNSTIIYTLYMADLHATQKFTTVFITVEQQTQCICNFALKSYIGDAGIIFLHVEDLSLET